MAGIAGIKSENKNEMVGQMLETMQPRGWAWQEVVNEKQATLGMVGLKNQEKDLAEIKNNSVARDGFVPGRLAVAQATARGFTLTRDRLGAAPLYYGWTEAGEFCFASEVKALLVATDDIHEFPAGCQFDGEDFKDCYKLEVKTPLQDSPETIAAELRKRLDASVEKCLQFGECGAWLSGGLDSSIMAALAMRRIQSEFHTFAAGLPGAPDLEHAKIMASHIKASHHEVVVKQEEIIQSLPDVIYALESFDALLVRSSILNFLVARFASHFVPAVFSGEGGDELFGGYAYLKKLKPEMLAGELVDITGRLHNTALQRVDRCASANGTVPHVGFLDPDLVDYALQIPTRYKIHDGEEKWILRQAVKDILPPKILRRTKAKFWVGGGFLSLLENYSEEKISDSDFKNERDLSNGWELNTKEELLYYRIFKERFGDLPELSWMGRTKSAPKS